MMYSNVPDPNLYPIEPDMYPGVQQQPMYPDAQPMYPNAQPMYPEVQIGAQPMYPDMQSGGYPGAQPMYPEVQPSGYPGAQPMYPEVQPGRNQDEWYVPPGSIPEGFELSNSDEESNPENENSNLVPLAQPPPPKNDWNTYSKFKIIVIIHKIKKVFFSYSLWCHILVTFLSRLKKLRSILRFRLKKLNCGFFHLFHS